MRIKLGGIFYTKMINSGLTRNPYFLFSPFLIIYIAFVFFFPTHGNVGDEPYYLMFANNLVEGYYSPPAPDVDLTDGPGYPIILFPFIALGSKLIFIVLLNAVLYYFSIVLIFKSLQELVSYKLALVVSLFWACYYHSFENLNLILSEILAIFLVSLIIYFIIKSFKSTGSRDIRKFSVLAGISIGYLTLTKVIFGYVLICLLIFQIFNYFINRKSENSRKGVIILLIAFGTILPYLMYTYSLTGKVLYWGTLGGNNLYWMSSPHHREYGDWFYYQEFKPDSTKYEPFSMPGRMDSIRMNHFEDHEKLFRTKGVERDDLYKKLAIDNIKSHPGKFLINCISNIGRILFNFPNSYTLQRPINLLRLPLNGLILVFLIFSSIITIINWRNVDYPIQFLILMALVYLGGSVLGSADPRMFTVIVPILLIWIAFIIYRSLKLNWKFDYRR